MTTRRQSIKTPLVEKQRKDIVTDVEVLYHDVLMTAGKKYPAALTDTTFSPPVFFWHLAVASQ